jgi:hypothetical protein
MSIYPWLDAFPELREPFGRTNNITTFREQFLLDMLMRLKAEVEQLSAQLDLERVACVKEKREATENQERCDEVTVSVIRGLKAENAALRAACEAVDWACQSVQEWDGDDGGVMMGIALSRRTIHQLRAACRRCRTAIGLSILPVPGTAASASAAAATPATRSRRKPCARAT